MKTRILNGIVVILTLAFSITTLPTAHADIVPAPGTTIETQWIPSGPASDGIQLNFYGDMNAQDNALLAGQIDLTDTPISAFANPFFCAPGTAFWCTPPSGPNACPSGQFAWAKGWQSVSVDSTACIDNFFTLLNMWNPNPAIFGPEIRWGSVGGTDTLNPYLAASQQDFHVLGELYDTLLRANPYDHSQIFSWMAASNGFVAPGSNGGLCPANANECLQMSLRGDIFSHDAFQMTASDVKFSYLTLNAAGASEGSCLGANNVVDVSFDPAVLPTSLGGTEFVGQSETLYVVFSAPPSSMSCFEQVPILPQHVWQTASSTGPCMTAGTSQCQVDTNYLSPGPCSDPAIVASSCTTSTGMIPAPSLVGSGPFVCASGPLGGAGTVVGRGCTSTGSSSVSAGGQIVLSRFGSGATLNTAYFRDNAKYLQWQWANLDQNVAVDLFDINIARSCASATPPLTGACLHYDTSASTLLCNSSAGPCILQNVGGDNDARAGGPDPSQALRWLRASWTSPLT